MDLFQLLGSATFQPPSNGMVEPGNIDLLHRPRVRNPDGSISTVRSAGANVDGREVLLPTVSDDGVNLSVPDAVEMYRRTGNHLGKFLDPQSATAYAEKLHDDQAKLLPPYTPIR